VSERTDWARYLLDAARNRTEVDPITATRELSVKKAYKLQQELVDAMGGRIIGAKLGLTSKAKQAQMNVDSPVFGWLTDAMLLGPEEPVRTEELIHPRAEPEIVFRMAEDIAGPGVTAADVLDAADGVAGGIEVIDSRYKAFSFTHADVIADNTSAARFTVGTTWVDPRDVDLGLLACLWEVNGDLVATAAGAALLGHPAHSVATLANHLGAQGRKLEAGWIVLAGGLTDAAPLAPGTHVTATYAHLGSVTLRAV
jgi:2-oxo-3-hexenedioate decarboxylase